jgi:hypothetical protein
MPNQRKRKTSLSRGAPPKPKKIKGAAPDQENAPSKKPQPDYKAISSKSTKTADQHKKILALLAQGGKTTIDLRRHGIMMPGTRILELRRKGKNITTELLAQYDDQGIRHNKVARYDLVEAVDAEVQA